MPEPRRETSRDNSSDVTARIINGPDPERFYCPHPGCNRSFAELWRLKVHYRAPPDIRGSGKERGHGTELKFCPKCGNELKPGKHHVGCSAGKSAPRQAAKRQRQMSTTTESEWATPSTTSADDNSDSWEETVRRQISKVQRQQSTDAESALQKRKDTGSSLGNVQSGANGNQGTMSCRLGLMHQALTAGDHTAELVFTSNTMADFGLILRNKNDDHKVDDCKIEPYAFHGDSSGAKEASQAKLERFDMQAHSPEASLGNILISGLGNGGEIDDGDVLSSLRAPSPPPLPPDWEIGSTPGFLFDFDQFDASRRNHPVEVSEPFMTVTSAMNPSEVSNPSDDYIWQIMFAGEDDAVPKRVTAHLHHSAHQNTHQAANEELARLLDAPDPFLDSLPWPKPEENGIPAKTAPLINGMPPPAPRLPGVSPQEDVPPLPQEALDALHAAGKQHEPENQGPQMVTVTYVVQQGPLGKPQYSVQRVDASGQKRTD